MPLLLLSQLAAAETPAAHRVPAKQTPQFLRLTRDKNNVPLAMETAIVRFAPAAGGRTPTVDLVAAVHIADAAYYRQLNREFQAYDAVLYELVAPEESKTPKPGDRRSDNPISTAAERHEGSCSTLEFQLKGIDYTCKNMVHADMSPEQFARSMQKRGESAWTMLGRMLAYAMAKENQTERRKRRRIAGRAVRQEPRVGAEAVAGRAVPAKRGRPGRPGGAKGLHAHQRPQ